jgi:hypothetical protein
MLVATAAIFALPLSVEARPGGGHFGGGHFGGGHFGGFHGGGFHFRGGHIGRLGGFRIGHFRGIRSGGFSRHALRGRNHAAPVHSSNHAPANAPNQIMTRPVANRPVSHGHGPLATRMSPAFSHSAFVHGASMHGFHRFGLFGWVGPLFWPYAFSDIYCDVFWGYWGSGCADPYWNAAYGDPFWDYGYGDIYGGLFTPFTFADLAPYLPNGPSSVRHVRARGVTPQSAVAQMCGDDTREVAGWPIDRISALVSPDERQRAALDDLAGATVKAAQIIKNGCPTSVAFTPGARLAAMQQRVEAMQQAVETVRGPLETFYGVLSEEQKAKFNAVSEAPAGKNGRQRGTAQGCAAANTAAKWPQAQIEAALKPNEAQQAKLKALENASAQAAEQLAASCPADLPATPAARLAAVSKRLGIMLAAVKSVRVALDDLYAGLSDEQKAQFNQIGQGRTQS